MNENSMKCKTSAPEVKKQRHFLFNNSYQVCTLKAATELYSAINQRPLPECQIFGSESLELICLLARQFHPYYFYTNTPTAVQSPLQLPSHNDYYALQSSCTPSTPFGKTSTALTQSNQSFWGGYWGITGLNGFYICTTIADLVAAMDDPYYLQLPQAQWFPDLKTAENFALHQYLKRFHQYFDLRFETLDIPPYGEVPHIWFDEHFEERIKRKEKNDSFVGLQDFYFYSF